jgi:hypothetical protein
MSAAAFALMTGSLTVLTVEQPAHADPCDLALGCGGPQSNVGTVPGCLGLKGCDNADPNAAPGGGPQPPGQQQPDPRTVAQQQALLYPLVVTLHSAPADTTYANFLTNLYLTWTPAEWDPGPVAGYTIRYKARFQGATWHMVEGTESCSTPGSATSSECSYTYKKASPNGGKTPYQITASTNFIIDWWCVQGCQASDHVPFPAPSRPYALTVDEIQNPNG